MTKFSGDWHVSETRDPPLFSKVKVLEPPLTEV